ncbi:limbin-like isoform X2 [Brachyhypopomus gauderio]|uniref:limbin-like isoform X2 n=1 Tax=Brachyhypopomus gauderio TaxID=698409 RepID=UPI004040FD85
MLTCFSRAVLVIFSACVLFLAGVVLWSTGSCRGSAADRRDANAHAHLVETPNAHAHLVETRTRRHTHELTLHVRYRTESNATSNVARLLPTCTCGHHGDQCALTREDSGKLRINAGGFESRSRVVEWSGDEAPSSAAAAPWGHAFIGRLTEAALGWGHQALDPRLRDPQHPFAQIRPSAVGLIFQKCAQIETGSELLRVRFYLVIKSPPEGDDLLQLRIRDTVANTTLLQTGGVVQERGYQTFTTDSLPAGSSYVETYTASMKVSRNEVLSLPAFLSFSKNSENDISLFDPVVANFTLRLNATEKVYAHHGLHFAGFSGGFLASTVLLSFMLLSASCLYNTWHKHSSHHRRRRDLGGGVELVEGVSIESSNEEAAFENKIISIMALEDPQNVFQALDNLEMSTLLREALAVEDTRVQLVKGVFGALLGGVGVAGQRLVPVLLGQVLGMEGRLQEEQVVQMATLAAQCSMETQREMEALHHKHTTEKTHAERLQHAEQKAVLEYTVLLERLQKMEQRCLQQGRLARQEEARAQAQRHIALRRRAELHAIFTEELQEAASVGELEEDMANQLLHGYYTCQDQLEEVLDLFVANQRAVLSERHARRDFLLQGVCGLQELLWDVFTISSQHIDCWFTEIHREGGLSDDQCSQQLEHAQLELRRVKQSSEDTINRERSTMHGDIIKTRQASISEMLCEQKRELQDRSSVCVGQVDQYLLQRQTVLLAHSMQLSELITHLDQQAATEIRKMLLRVLQGAVVELKAVVAAVSRALRELGVPRWLLHREVGAEALAEAQERLRVRRKTSTDDLRASRCFIQQRRRQEIHQQKVLRERLRQFCRSVCASQTAMSEKDLLRVRLESVKRTCGLDRCLVLPRARWQAGLFASLTITQCSQRGSDPDASEDADSGNTSLRLKGSKTVLSSGECSTEASVPAKDLDLHSLIRSVEERIYFHQQERRRNTCVEEVYEDWDQKARECEQGVAQVVVAVQWERRERRLRVLETHSALLELLTMLLPHVPHTPADQELTNTVQAQSLALEELEFQLQKEEAELVYDCSSDEVWAAADRMDVELFGVDEDCRMATSLQEALCKRQQLTHTLTERLMEEIRRQQVMEDVREKLELKPLYAHCEQDLALAAVLVKLSGVTLDVLQELLHLLLPTLPEGELQSLLDALSPKAAQELEPCRDLVDRLRKDIVKRNLSSCYQHTDRQTGRILKKKQTLLAKLFSSSAEGSKGIPKVQFCCKSQVQEQTSKEEPVPVSDAAKEDATTDPVCVTGGATGERRHKESIPSEHMGIAVESPVSGERLFIFQCHQPGKQEDVHSSPLPSLDYIRKKKRSFLKFKKGSVAPQE